MKIAVLSDIHGNDVALRAVLSEVDAIGVDKLLLLGDYVGYYYNAHVVLDLIQKYDKEMIKGNHELLLEESLLDSKRSLAIQKKYGSGIEHAKKTLSEEQIRFLIGLPEKIELEIDGSKILMCHGSPWDVCEYIYPDAPNEVKNRCLEFEADFVFIGHSHYPFVYENDHGVLMSVGSVGQNRKVGGLANWGFVDTQNNVYVIKETPFDRQTLLDQAKSNDPDHKYLATILNREPSSE